MRVDSRATATLSDSECRWGMFRLGLKRRKIWYSEKRRCTNEFPARSSNILILDYSVMKKRKSLSPLHRCIKKSVEETGNVQQNR